MNAFRADALDLPLIPFPAHLEEHEGRCRLAAGCRVDGDGDAAGLLAPWLAAALTGAAAEGIAAIRLIADPTRADLGDEGCELVLAPDAALAVARDQRGLRHAAQILRQLLAACGHDLPACEIRDRPRFAWRGLMLDVARHVHGPGDVCRLLDLMALHRLNIFHWHLTDDQGWRLPVPSRPRLTTVGAWRSQTKVGHYHHAPAGYDGRPYGGSYSAADIRRVVAHAARLGITVVPEIDLPGHMQAAIAAYPELGNGLHAPAVRETWGVSTQILNCSPAAFAFVEEVLTEVLALFPSPWIHLGGDEVPLDEWRESPAARAEATRRGCGVDGLQHVWTSHCAAWLAARGRRLVGWDEIHERSGAALPVGSTVMAWRDEKHGVAAAQAGFDVVMAPVRPTYLDYAQRVDERLEGDTIAPGTAHTLEDCAAWEPLPAALRGTPAAARVLGGQCQVWTEYIATRDRLDHMAFPRACALAEALWTPTARRSVPGFLARLAGHRRLLDRLGVRCRAG